VTFFYVDAESRDLPMSELPIPLIEIEQRLLRILTRRPDDSGVLAALIEVRKTRALETIAQSLPLITR